MNLLKLLPAMREGLRMSKLLQSQTTKEQWKGTAIMSILVCVIIAVLRTQVTTVLGLEISEEVWLGIATAVLTLMAPLTSRVLAFTDTPILKLGEFANTEAIRVRKREMQSWRPYDSDFASALADGFDLAVDMEGRIYDLRSGAYTDAKIRLSDAEKRRYEGGK